MMTTEFELLDRDDLHATFTTWAEEEESLDAQLRESLAALAAYQSHLEDWQMQLADERTALIEAREQFERDQSTAATSRANSSGEAGAELTAARQEIAELSASLLARTEELHTVDQRRAALVTELETVRTREEELLVAVDEQKQLREQERAQSAEDLQQAREALEHQVEAAAATGNANSISSAPPTGLPRVAASTNRERSSGGAVLGSIVEQFGKLRQQRAVDRQASKKTR